MENYTTDYAMVLNFKGFLATANKPGSKHVSFSGSKKKKLVHNYANLGQG